MADLRASGLGGVPKGATADRPSSPSIGDVFYNGTLGYLEIYTSFGWLAATPTAAAIPAAPVGTNVGTSRAYNNGAVSVAFAPNQGGGLPSSFTITASTGQTASGATSPVIVTGIATGATPTFTVSASNAMGTSSASSASSAVTVTTIPQAPTVSAATGNAQSVLTLTGATGGSAITSWSITSSPATTTQTATSSPYTFTGLTNGTAYTFTATAINANGTSAASSASNSITPANTIPADYLVVAGGGGGGGSYHGHSGGGGGAGGYRTTIGTSGKNSSAESQIILIPGTTYTVTVGAGGAGGTSSVSGVTAHAAQGQSSSISGSGLTTVTSIGGGYGGGADNGGTYRQGGSGGSGGGSGGSDQVGVSGGNGTDNQGFNGGSGGQSIGYAGSGGGAASAGALNSNVTLLTNGGSGITSSISGTSVTYSSGGACNGGDQGSARPNATSNTGNGGQSAFNGNPQPPGGNGGSGVVIIKTLATASSASVSPTTDGSYKVYRFTATGSITF